MIIQALNLETEKLENIDLDIDTVMNYVNNNRTKCKLYTRCSYYEVKDSNRYLLVKIDNVNRNIESFTSADVPDLYNIVKKTEELRTCRISSVIPNLKFRFSVRASVSKFMFSYDENGLDVVTSNLPIVNTLRSTVYATHKFPRKLLMWDYLNIDELGENIVFKINFIKNELENMNDNDISDVLEMNNAGKGSKKFINHLLEMSGYDFSEGKDIPTNEFDFVSTSESELSVRSKLYKEQYIVIKDKILCNDKIAMGMTSQKISNAIFMKKFISRMLMIFKYKGVVPCFSIINFKNMFGFYPIWYLHPDVSIYGGGTMQCLLDTLEVVDVEDAYDKEEEVKDVWKYFVPYYMADDWTNYAEMVAEEKAKLAGFNSTPSVDLVDEKDFMEFMLINKFTRKPRQLTNIVNGIISNNQLHFEPGKIPNEYRIALKGYRCNMYVFEEDGELFVRDCVNLKTITLSSLDEESMLKRIANLLIKFKLVFRKVSPILYVCRVDNYIFRMSQIGTVYMDEVEGDNKFLLSAPSVISDDINLIIQAKRFGCNTKTDEYYKMQYGNDNLPKLVERAMYRSKGLDGFIRENEKDIEVFGTRRNPNFENSYEAKQALSWDDVRDVYNLYYGSNIMQWVRMGARGNSSDSRVMDEPDWDRIIWYCPLNTWFASIEMATRKSHLGKNDLQVILNNRYNPEYFYFVEEFYFWNNVCLVRGDMNKNPWRLCVDSIPLQYVDLNDIPETDRADYMFYEENKGHGLFALSLEDKDILFRCKQFIIVESDNHRYLIGGKNECGVYVVENEVISRLDRGLLKSLEKSEDISYINNIWRLLFISDFTKVTVLNDNLYYVEQERHSYGEKVSAEDLKNPHTISAKFYVYIENIIYIFRCDDDVVSVRSLDNKTVEVNGEMYFWSAKRCEFLPSDELEEVNELMENKSEEDSMSEIVEEDSRFKVVEVEESKEDCSRCNFSETDVFKTATVGKNQNNVEDWLYDFATDFIH